MIDEDSDSKQEESVGTQDNNLDNEQHELAEKQRHVQMLKKLLESRLRKRLEQEEEFKPSPQVK